MLESDCLKLEDVKQGGKDHNVETIVFDIVHISRGAGPTYFTHVNRFVNHVAHSLATHASRMDLLSFSFSSLPLWV